MPKPPPLKIGECDCPACGTVLSLKVNSKGTVYVYCNHKIPDGSLCFYRATFGRSKSRELVNAYMGQTPLVQQMNPTPEPEIKEPEENAKPENVTEPTTADTGAGRAEPEPAPRKSFLGGILGDF